MVFTGVFYEEGRELSQGKGMVLVSLALYDLSSAGVVCSS
jgi:hypothetical protein